MKSRSPSYPGIDLATALERARAVYEHEGRQAAAVDALYGDWGLKPRSGAGGVVLAALKKFGLVADEGAGATRRARLTDLALSILLGQSGSGRRDEAIQRAALLPRIHQEVWGRYDSELPSDARLRLWLVRDLGFTPAGSDAFIRQVKRTLAFAGLAGPDRVGGGLSGSATEERRRMSTPNTGELSGGGRSVEPVLRAAGRPSTSRSILLPLGVGWATLEAPFPLSEEAWSLMISELTAMRPGLVAEPAREARGEADPVPRWPGVAGE